MKDEPSRVFTKQEQDDIVALARYVLAGRTFERESVKPNTTVKLSDVERDLFAVEEMPDERLLALAKGA